MVFSKWFTSGSKDFPSCCPFNSPGKFTVTGFDVHFTIVTALTSVFYNVSIEVICLCGVYSSTFFTDWVVWQPVVCQRLPSVLVKNGLDLIVLFKGHSNGFKIRSILIHFKWYDFAVSPHGYYWGIIDHTICC